MNIEYTLDEQDFLAFQLFAVDTNPETPKKKLRNRIIYTFLCGVLATYMFTSGSNALGIYFSSIGAICAIFYPKYFAWRYKRHFSKHVKNTHSGSFGMVESLTFKGEDIHSKSPLGEGTLKLNQVEKIEETSDHLFMKFKPGQSLIVPKRDLNNLDELHTFFSKKGLAVIDLKSWRWR